MQSQDKDQNRSKDNDKETIPTYRKPELFFIGRASKLVQGLPSGKNSDGYTGYYWE